MVTMDKANEIDHSYTDNITCPHCGNEDHDSWEHSPSDEELGLIECTECEKHFYATRNIQVSYSTDKANYGTCKHCNESDIPIEDYWSSIGKYEGLCVKCGAKEKYRLEKAYIERLESKSIESNE